MVLRSVAKIAVAAAEAVTKAFTRAVRDELRASQQAAARQTGSNGANADSKTKDAAQANARLGISLQESVQILDVKMPLNVEEVNKRYNHLFEANDKAKGGSFYLQSKIYRAKERIDDELSRTESEEKKAP